MNRAACTLGVLLGLAGGSLCAQPPRPDPLAENLFPPDLILRFQSEIGLTAEERGAITAEMERAHPRFEELHGQLRRETEKLGDLLKKERVDEEAALAQFDEVRKVEGRIQRTHLALVIGLKNKLTKKQQAKLHDLRERLAAGQPPASIPSKLEKVKAGVEAWQGAGRDPTAVAEIMQGFEPLMKEGMFKEAEALLDRALKLIEEDQPDEESRLQKRESAAPPARSPSQAAKAENPDAMRAEIEGLIATRDVPWREISWHSCLLEGLKESREKQRPLLLWVFIDRPADDRRC